MHDISKVRGAFPRELAQPYQRHCVAEPPEHRPRAYRGGLLWEDRSSRSGTAFSSDCRLDGSRSQRFDHVFEKSTNYGLYDALE